MLANTNPRILGQFVHYIFKDHYEVYIRTLLEHFRINNKIPFHIELQDYIEFTNELSRRNINFPPTEILTQILEKSYEDSDSLYVALYSNVKSLPTWDRYFLEPRPHGVLRFYMNVVLHHLITELANDDSSFRDNLNLFRSKFL